MSKHKQQFLTAGEFAKLARTTKRTVLWYAEQGILEPYEKDDSGYRLYRPEQIIDFQGLLLMRKLGFSIADIKEYVEQGTSLQDLFESKRSLIEQQITELQRSLADTEHYYANLAATGTLVQPHIKRQDSFEIYYIDRQGPHASIKDYFVELQAMFSSLPANATFLTIFSDKGYNPKNARMKIGVVKAPGIQLKAVDISPPNAIQQQAIPTYQALSYMHHGPTALLSLLWQELYKYRTKQRLPLDNTLPFADLEFYTMGNKRAIKTTGKVDQRENFATELQLPIRSLI